MCVGDTGGDKEESGEEVGEEEEKEESRGERDIGGAVVIEGTESQRVSSLACRPREGATGGSGETKELGREREGAESQRDITVTTSVPLCFIEGAVGV